MSPRAGKHGCATSTGIPRNIATRSPKCRGWFDENDVEYLRTYPSALIGEDPEDLFAQAPDNWRPEGWLAQLGWIRTLGKEGGLFVTVGQRRG